MHVIFLRNIVQTEGKGSAQEKIKAFADAGIPVSRSPADMGKTMVEAMKKK